MPAVLGLVHIAKYIYSKLDFHRITVIKDEKDLQDYQAWSLTQFVLCGNSQKNYGAYLCF